MSKTAHTLKHILEIVWLIVALISFAISVRETYYAGIKGSWMFYLFSLIAFFFYFSRRKERLNS